jgi:hypothetical protein
MTDCPQLETAGVYVLGALDDAERDDYAAHLDTCAVCHREYDRLADLPALLDLASDRRVISVPAEAEERFVARLRERPHRVGRWRRTPVVAAGAGLLGAAAAAAAILGFGIGDDAPVPSPTIVLAPASGSASAGAWATAKLHNRSAGTIVDFEAGGLPWTGAGERYVVLISEGGKVVARARFTVNANGWAQVAVTTVQKLYPDAQLEVRRDAPGEPLVLRSNV